MKITENMLLELIHHEAIVLEAYKDSVGVWTWGVGVTDASGHRVGRYKDKPQTVQRVLEVFEWLVREKYAPPVVRAMGSGLSEHEFAAAVSFHYNTGAIGRATWVKDYNRGDIVAARSNIMNWNKAGGKVSSGLTKRRTKERDLFFEGKWDNDGGAKIYPVRKPSYSPDFARGKRFDITADVKAALRNAG